MQQQLADIIADNIFVTLTYSFNGSLFAHSLAGLVVRACINYKGGIEDQHNNGRLSGVAQIYLQPVHERLRLRWHSLPHVDH